MQYLQELYHYFKKKNFNLEQELNSESLALQASVQTIKIFTFKYHETTEQERHFKSLVLDLNGLMACMLAQKARASTFHY